MKNLITVGGAGSNMIINWYWMGAAFSSNIGINTS